MIQICRCLSLGRRVGFGLARKISMKEDQGLCKRILPISCSNLVRYYAKKEQPEQPERKFMFGKEITEEVEDPNLYPKFLMVLTGYDESVLDGFFHFAKKAARLVDVNLSKDFRMPSKETVVKSEIETESSKKKIEYNLKKFERVIEIADLRGDKSDIFIEYLQKALPPGVQIEIQLKSWEMYVDPDHPSLRKDVPSVRHHKQK